MDFHNAYSIHRTTSRIIASENLTHVAMKAENNSELGLAAKLNLLANSRVLERTNLWVKGRIVKSVLGPAKHII